MKGWKQMTIGQTIRDLRSRKSMKQWELASKLCVDVTTVSKWEHDKSTPTIYTLSEICIIFGVDMDVFAVCNT